ncbi:hypothetical protein CIPAW_16G112800 [Carya illinoinensis]|uniref:Uncharacterized protein n=1 Tax=Carya illinoinensis TaxID=32201 RepID=A0A8T1N8Y0_CARIL|nr:hypothetical protein CIPAW_16G112800 [Carya illinoinensis]
MKVAFDELMLQDVVCILIYLRFKLARIDIIGRFEKKGFHLKVHDGAIVKARWEVELPQQQQQQQK